MYRTTHPVIVYVDTDHRGVPSLHRFHVLRERPL